MSIEDLLKLVGAVALSFGGGAVIVIALSGWLADIWAKRILQREQSALSNKLEEAKHELALTKSSYDHYLDLILDYYKVFYRHYRLCQRTATADGHRQPDGEVTSTQEEFLNALDQFLSDWAEQEGKIRLLLPSKVLALHEEAVTRFNRFKQAVDAFRKNDETREEKRLAFLEIDALKIQLEETLREFLRTEKLLK